MIARAPERDTNCQTASWPNVYILHRPPGRKTQLVAFYPIGSTRTKGIGTGRARWVPPVPLGVIPATQHNAEESLRFRYLPLGIAAGRTAFGNRVGIYIFISEYQEQLWRGLGRTPLQGAPEIPRNPRQWRGRRDSNSRGATRPPVNSRVP